MQVTVRLVGVFRIDRFREERRCYPETATVRDIVCELGIPLSLLGIVLINGSHAAIDDQFRDGDTITLLPFIDGG